MAKFQSVRLTILMFFLSVVENESATPRRNVLLIVADDAGLEMGAYNNIAIETPNLDRLANKGTLFNKAFASVSSCSPSRSAILTGKPNHWNGMYGLHNGVHHFNSFDKTRSLPSYLSKHRVQTGIIGKKHVGPSSAYKFDYEQTEENHSVLQVGRNITFIKLLVREFLSQAESKPFFLYVAFHDPHRCGHTHPEFGNFCENFGNGEEKNGLIPDWQPKYYDPESVKVPYYTQDTPAARGDIAAQYATISRLDQGVGLVLNELDRAGFSENTLVIYTSDNGPPFPAGRTNLYDSGIAVPFILYSPTQPSSHGLKSDVMMSHLDILPLVLDWFQIHPKPKQSIRPLSLSTILNGEVDKEDEAVYASHSLHEVTMSYPMRAIRTKQFKLIHNLNYKSPYPIDQDFYLSPSFQDILNRSAHQEHLPWYRSLKNYYYRPEWELYDLNADVEEIYNLAYNVSHEHIFSTLRNSLLSWQNSTNDPWICGLGAVLQNSGNFKSNPQCLSLFNGM